MNRTKFSLDIEDSEPVTDEIDKKAIKNFASGAFKHEILTQDWQNESPDAIPSYNFRLRLNKYQIGFLKHISKLEKRSLSNMIRVILIEGLSERIK